MQELKPARTVVVVLIAVLRLGGFASAVGIGGRAGGGAQVRGGVHRVLPQPKGSTQEAVPARVVVVVLIARLPWKGWRPSAPGVQARARGGTEVRPDLHGGLRSAVRVDARRGARADRGRVAHRGSPCVGPRQPLGSMDDPSPARTWVRELIRPPSAVGIQGAAARGADGGARLHRSSPVVPRRPSGSIADPTAARRCVWPRISRWDP